jgi:hypothetical protein
MARAAALPVLAAEPGLTRLRDFAAAGTGLRRPNVEAQGGGDKDCGYSQAHDGAQHLLEGRDARLPAFLTCETSSRAPSDRLLI